MLYLILKICNLFVHLVRFIINNFKNDLIDCNHLIKYNESLIMIGWTLDLFPFIFIAKKFILQNFTSIMLPSLNQCYMESMIEWLIRISQLFSFEN